MNTFKTIADVRAANKAIGHHFFSRETMRHWRSRIESSLYGGRYFVTSEQGGDDKPRIYKVREVRPDGSIATDAVGHDFGQLWNARETARRMARGTV
jgi:hypothetical protein